jgi:hypothetical protein
MILGTIIAAYTIVGCGCAVAVQDGADLSIHPRRVIITGAVLFGVLWPLAALYKAGYLIGEWME